MVRVCDFFLQKIQISKKKFLGGVGGGAGGEGVRVSAFFY